MQPQRGQPCTPTWLTVHEIELIGLIDQKPRAGGEGCALRRLRTEGCVCVCVLKDGELARGGVCSVLPD